MSKHFFSRHWRQLAIKALSIASLACIGLSAIASDIVIGQVTPLTGVFGPPGQQMSLGAKVWFDAINSQGGIRGQKIKHVLINAPLDNVEGLQETLKITQNLIDTQHPVALIGYLGTGPVALIIKDGILERSNTPMIGPFTGNPTLHTNPPYPWLYHVRAKYTEETAHMADNLATTGIKRVAVFYQDDDFGKAVVGGFEATYAKFNTKDFKTEIIARGTYNTFNQKNEAVFQKEIDTAVKQIAASQPQAVIMITGTTKAAGAFAKAYRQAGGFGMMYTTSIIDPKEIVKIAGLDAVRGMGITQITPYPFSGVSKLVKEFHSNFKKFAPPDASISYAVFEGYIGARILTDGIQRAGINPTSAKVAQALQTMGSVDLGGFMINYSPNNRSGSHFVEITTIGAEGRILR